MIYWRASASAVNMGGADRSPNGRTVHKNLPLPLNTQEVAVLWVDWNYAIGVHFCHKCTTTEV